MTNLKEWVHQYHFLLCCMQNGLLESIVFITSICLVITVKAKVTVRNFVRLANEDAYEYHISLSAIANRDLELRLTARHWYNHLCSTMTTCWEGRRQGSRL